MDHKKNRAFWAIPVAVSFFLQVGLFTERSFAVDLTKKRQNCTRRAITPGGMPNTSVSDRHNHYRHSLTFQ